MKKLVFYAIITFCGLLHVSAGCSEKKEESVEADNPAVTGYWKLSGGFSFGKKADTGEWVQMAVIKPGTIAYDFKSDKTFISYDLTGNFPEASGTWKLHVKSQSGKNIGSAELFLYSDNLKDLAGSDALETDGSMKFQLSTQDGSLHLVSEEIAIGPGGRYSHLRNEMTFSQGK